MPLAPGTQLGPYRIAAPLGAGGMGEVYRATDTKLQREVAIKVLPDEVAGDPERLGRFEREARVLASLNHPNIGHIYGLEEADGVRALVLELVEGPTLAERIARGPVPWEEALPIAKQIAYALEAAHGRGIVHRDLKPANVKVKPDGTVKVLDFGLARAGRPEVPDSDPAASPTLTAATGMGVILGTAAYMAPEQARGRPVDKRADVWAFGVVLFEMLSGRRPFAGADVSETLARVIEREPDWATLPADLPPVLGAFLARCLAKEPGQRIHDVADLRLAIEGGFDAAVAGPVSTGRRFEARHLGMAIAITALAVAATMAVLGRPGRPSANAGRGVVRFTVPAPKGEAFVASVEHHDLALAPDGRRLAFVAASEAGTRLWLRSLDRDTAEPLAGTDGAHSPFWSPDGEWLAFFTATHLLKLRPGKGPPVEICAASGVKTGAWGADDTILFTQNFSMEAGISSVAAEGGTPQRIVERSEREGGHRWPVFLADGDRFFYSAFAVEGSTEAMTLHVGRLSSADTRRVFALDSRVAVVGDHLVYVDKGNLVARRFDFEQLRLAGDPLLLGTDLPQFATAWAPFTVSAAGALAYGSRSGNVRLFWSDDRGHDLGEVVEPGRYRGVARSADGSKLAIETQDGAERDIWIHDLERGGRTRFTSEAGLDSRPVWSPDGSRIAYTRHGPNADNGMYVRDVDGGDAIPLHSGIPFGLPWISDWSRDGKRIVFRGFGDLWFLPMTGGGSPFPRRRTRFTEEDGRFSPDGRWLAYASNESGNFEIYVAAVDGTERGARVSTGGGANPWWSDAGDRIFYNSSTGVAAAEIRFRPGEPLPERPTELFSTDAELHGVAENGERLLLAEETDSYTVRMILNWTDVLEVPD